MNSPRLKTNGISDTRLPEFPNPSFSEHSALLSIVLAASVSGCSQSGGAYNGLWDRLGGRGKEDFPDIRR